MNRISYYEISLSKIVTGGGNRNIDSYYFVLYSESSPVKLISKSMRIDQDNQDVLQGQVQIKPSNLELWNYDKMKNVQNFKVDFKKEQTYKWSLFSENMEILIQRKNIWQSQNKKKQQNNQRSPPKQEEIQLRSSKQSTKPVNSRQSTQNRLKAQSRQRPLDFITADKMPPTPHKKTTTQFFAKTSSKQEIKSQPGSNKKIEEKTTSSETIENEIEQKQKKEEQKIKIQEQKQSQVKIEQAADPIQKVQIANQ